MSYKIRLWIKDEEVLCCSSMCTNFHTGEICPRVGICKETEIEELDKQSSMKPVGFYFCPTCEIDLGHFQNEESDEELLYCGHCGQKLDWSDC